MIKDEDLPTDLEIEKKAIMHMSEAKVKVEEAIIRITSALSLRCFAKNKIENAEDVESLSKALDTLISVRDSIAETLKPYFIFHEIDEHDVNEWLIDLGEPEEEQKFGKKR